MTAARKYLLGGLTALLLAFVIAGLGILPSFGAPPVAQATEANRLQIYSWGLNNHGQLGQNDTQNYNSPYPIYFFEDYDIVKLETGDYHAILVTAAGEVFVWGYNNHGQLGLGSSAGSQIAPVLSPALSNLSIARLYVGGNHNFIVTPQGYIYAWGCNTAGQLGLGDLQPRYLPQRVHALTGLDVVSLHVGFEHTFAITRFGEVYAWGSNTFNELGLPDGPYRTEPTRVPTLSGLDIARLYMGVGNTFAIMHSGDVYAWGANDSGQLGLNDSSSHVNTPTRVPVLSGLDLDALFIGRYHNFAITTTGEIYAWGSNGHGRLGLGHNTDMRVPKRNHELESLGVTEIHMGRMHSFAIADNGNIYAWGNNGQGRLGIGNNQHQNRPQLVTELPYHLSAIDLRVGYAHAFAFTGTLIRSTPNLPQPPEAGYDSLTKTLLLPKGTEVPEITFEFEFTPISVNMAPEGEGPVYSQVVTPPSGIPNQSIAFDLPAGEYDIKEIEGGIVMVQNYLNIYTRINELVADGTLVFPGAGIFTWHVTEVAGSSGTSLPSHVYYSDAKYELRIWVSEGDTPGVFEPSIIEIFLVQIDSNNPDESRLGKVDYMRFTNIYLTDYDPQDPEQSALEISKTVAGNFADLQVPFTFQLTLNDPALGNLPDTVHAYIVAASGAQTPIMLQAGGVINNFTLQHDERLVIPTVLAGSIFWVRESPTPQHTPSATVTTGGVAATPPYAGTNGSALQITDNFHRVSNAGSNGSGGGASSNSVAFVNTHNWSIPTGLIVEAVPFAAFLTVLMLMAAVSRSKRRRIEMLPVV
jgi:alpha-tubulin suppressor-like RCC1 family protein